MHHLLAKVVGVGIVGAVGYVIERTWHGAPGKAPVTPHGNTVTPQGVVVPPAGTLTPPSAPPSNTENLAQAASDAVKAMGWQNPSAMSAVSAFQGAWMHGGGSDIGTSGRPDGKWGPNTEAAAASLGIVDPAGAYYVPATPANTSDTPVATAITNILGPGDVAVADVAQGLVDILG